MPGLTMTRRSLLQVWCWFGAVVWFAVRGVVVGCVLFGNGSAYGSYFWMDVCGQLGITVTKTCCRRLQTNGKIE